MQGNGIFWLSATDPIVTLVLRLSCGLRRSEETMQALWHTCMVGSEGPVSHPHLSSWLSNLHSAHCTHNCCGCSDTGNPRHGKDSRAWDGVSSGLFQVGSWFQWQDSSHQNCRGLWSVPAMCDLGAPQRWSTWQGVCIPQGSYKQVETDFPGHIKNF